MEAKSISSSEANYRLGSDPIGCPIVAGVALASLATLSYFFAKDHNIYWASGVAVLSASCFSFAISYWTIGKCERDSPEHPDLEP